MNASLILKKHVQNLIDTWPGFEKTRTKKTKTRDIGAGAVGWAAVGPEMPHNLRKSFLH